MNVPQDELNKWRADVSAITAACAQARRDNAAGDAERVRAGLTRLYDTAWRLGMRMDAAGAERPNVTPATPDLAIGDLELLGSPANRDLLDALRRVADAARRVDRERGEPSDGGPADLYDILIARTEAEIFGARK